MKICFLPFWQPYMSFASSRLRAVFPAEALRSNSDLSVHVGWQEDANWYFVVQLCSDRMLDRLRRIKMRGATIVYVVCDRHFDHSGISVGGISVVHRFEELVAIADSFLVPTEGMKLAILNRNYGKPIFVIQDSQDYISTANAVLVEKGKNIAWFGNPGTSNFAAAEPYLAWFQDNDFVVRIISTRSWFGHYDRYRDSVIEWNYSTFVENLRLSSISFLAFHDRESQKSENRLVTSVVNGVPAIISGRSRASQILLDNELGDCVVNDFDQLRLAAELLSSDDYRSLYITRLQDYCYRECSQARIASQYLALISAESSLGNNAKAKHGIL